MMPSAVSNLPANGTPALTVCIVAAILSLVFTKVADAQRVSHTAAGHSTQSASVGAPSPQERQLALDRDRLEFEKQKFVVETKRENDKLENEKTKAYWSAISTIVPIIAALLTLGYSVYSFRRQSSEAARLQNETAKLQFEIKAAEIAFTGKTPKAVENRGRVLKKIFGKRLPEDFPAPFDAAELGGGKETPAEKITFLDLLLKHPGKEQHIFNLWNALFADPWLERVKPVLTGLSGNGLDKGEAEKENAGGSVTEEGAGAGTKPT